jgi:uncharacterized protein (TIGR00251 family)
LSTTPPPDATKEWPCLRLDRKAGQVRVIIDISVSPNAKRTELVGWHDGALRVRLAAPPVDGAANEALRKWLAKELDVPQSQLELLRGASGRRKQWAVEAPLPQVQGWLARQTALQN